MLSLIVALALATSPELVAAPAPGASSPAIRPQVEAPITAPGAIAVDLTSGVVLFERSADTSLPPASTTKLVTALTVRRVLERHEQITIEESDMLAEEFSRMGVEPGDVLSVEQLLYGALVPSGGDAALALARVAGARLDPSTAEPIARFVQEMNAVAADIGMTGSEFGNPVGLDDQQSWTTARDMLRAAERVLGDPVLAPMVATPWASVPIGGPNARDIIIENTNQFVLFDGAIGVKTGTTDAAGQNLVNAFRYGDHIIVTVVLGSDDRYVDTSTLLDAIAAQWEWLVVGGSAPSLGATDELNRLGFWMPVSRTLMVSTDQLQRVTYEIQLAEEATGLYQGLVRYSLDGQVLAELPVYPQREPAGASEESP